MAEAKVALSTIFALSANLAIALTASFCSTHKKLCSTEDWTFVCLKHFVSLPTPTGANINKYHKYDKYDKETNAKEKMLQHYSHTQLVVSSVRDCCNPYSFVRQ
jgi:hypothetical protein